MSNDIVERLRHLVANFNGAAIMEEAANEIERLRAGHALLIETIQGIDNALVNHEPSIPDALRIMDSIPMDLR